MPKEQNISQDLYNLLLTRDFDPETTDRQGQATTPNEGVVFSFDYVSGSGRNYGTAVLVITDDAELLLFFGDNLGKSMEDPDKTEWFEFLQQLKQFATRHNFHTFSPQNLNQLKHTMAGMAAIREGLFEGYYGTRRQSYMGEPQQARLVIRHDRDIAEGDARYRHIESIFIETAEGERFRLGFRNLSGARAMLEHVRQGGRPYDVRGVHISEMVQEIQLLSRFNRASARRVVEGTEHLVEAARTFYTQLRRDLASLGHGRGYAAYFESWRPAEIQLSDGLVEDLRGLFVEQRIDDRIEAALPVLAKVEKQMQEIAVFENWAANLSEGTWTLPETPEQQKKLRELMAKELPLGPDATNATEQLYDLVGDDELFDILGVAAKYDPDANAWEVPGVAERLEELGVEMPGADATADQADAGAAAAAQPTANAAAPVGNVAPVSPAQPIAEADNISQFEQAGGTVAQRTAAYQQQLLDRMGARFGLPPGSSLEQVKAAQLAWLDKNDPQAAAQARAGQPVQLAKRDLMQDPNFAQGLAAAKAGKGPLAIMLAQPDIANNQKYLDTIASSYGLPAGLTAQEIQAQADKKFARPAQPAAQATAQPAAQPVSEVKHKGKRVSEGHADQQKKIFKKNGQPVGEVGIDRESSPGVGQYYMKHYASGTDNSGYDSREEALAELRHIMKQSIYGELREQGIAEADTTGPHIVYATGPRTQGINDVDLVFKDIRTGKIVARVVGNNRHLQEFAPPSGGDGGDGRDFADRPPTYEIRMGDMKRITYVAFGDPEQDSEHSVYKLGPAKPGAPKYYGQGLTLVSELDWWSFLEKMIGEIMWEDDAIEAGYVDRLDNGDLVFAQQQGVAEGTDFFDRFGLPIMPDDDGKFQDMMRGIKRGTKKQARADRRARDVASRERARAAFGPSPADKLSIRRDQGVAEAGPFSYGKAPRKGSVADLAAKKRKEQEKGKPAIEPKDQMVGVAKVTKGVAEGGYNPLDDERQEQSRMDAERRQFKRDELAAELGGEEQRAQQIMRGTWYIVIDGQVWKRGGQPVTFPGRDAARRAGQTIKNRTPERTVTITTRIPAVEAAACNHTMEGEMCPEHGLAECGMAEGRDDPMNYNAAITGSYYESQDTDLLARIKQLALLK